MPRKRNKLKEYDYTSQEYWNRLLNQDGLSMDRGKSKHLLYLGGNTDLETLEGLRRMDTGRVAPAPTSDEDKE